MDFMTHTERIDLMQPCSFMIKIHSMPVFISTVFNTGPEEVNAIRFSRNRMGSSYIKDAYIYNSMRNKKGQTLTL